MEEQFEELGVIVRKYLGNLPKTIVFDRAEFVMSRDNFQRTIDANVDNWRVIRYAIPSNELIVIFWRQAWHRAVVKLFDKGRAVFQLVDSSAVVRDRFTLRKRRIDSPEIANEPWGRVKGYIYGAMYVNIAKITPQVQEIYDSFFNVSNNVTAVMIKIPQTRQNRLRYVYACDFVAKTGGKFQSFRDLLLSSTDQWIRLSIHQMHQISNIEHHRLVDELVNRLNSQMTLHRSVNEPDIELVDVHQLKVESAASSLVPFVQFPSDYNSAALPFNYEVSSDSEVELHHLIWTPSTDGGMERGELIGVGSVGFYHYYHCPQYEQLSYNIFFPLKFNFQVWQSFHCKRKINL